MTIKKGISDFKSRTSSRTRVSVEPDPDNGTSVEEAFNSEKPVFFTTDSPNKGIYVFSNRESGRFTRLMAVETTIPVYSPSGCYVFESEVFSTRIYCPSEERSQDLFLQFKQMIITEPNLLLDPTPLAEEFGGRVFGSDLPTYDLDRIRRMVECSD